MFKATTAAAATTSSTLHKYARTCSRTRAAETHSQVLGNPDHPKSHKVVKNNPLTPSVFVPAPRGKSGWSEECAP